MVKDSDLPSDLKDDVEGGTLRISVPHGTRSVSVELNDPISERLVKRISIVTPSKTMCTAYNGGSFVIPGEHAD